MDELLIQGELPLQRKDWVPTPQSLNRLLNWLDSGADSQGQSYEEMRRKLIAYFDRKNCLSPDDLADETLNRVMKWLEEKDKQFDPEPARICYHTARFVFMEYLRKAESEQGGIEDLPSAHQPSENPHSIADQEDEQEAKEKRLECLEGCAQKLQPEEREMIIQYYYGEQRVKIENRRVMAERMKISVNALSIRACRVRDKLKACVSKCAAT